MYFQRLAISTSVADNPYLLLQFPNVNTLGKRKPADLGGSLACYVPRAKCRPPSPRQSLPAAFRMVPLRRYLAYIQESNTNRTIRQ